MPTTLPDGMVIAAILERESPLDAVVMKASLVEKEIVRIDQLGENALIGSSSLRRQAQLKRKFPKLRIESVRGNLNTRYVRNSWQFGEDYIIKIISYFQSRFGANV